MRCDIVEIISPSVPCFFSVVGNIAQQSGDARNCRWRDLNQGLFCLANALICGHVCALRGNPAWIIQINNDLFPPIDAGLAPLARQYLLEHRLLACGLCLPQTQNS